MKRYYLIVMLTFLPISLFAIKKTDGISLVQAPFPITLSGYIKNDSYWDTRQVNGSQDDQILLYPERKKLDSNCQDINAKGQYDMVAIQTRMRFDIEGPKIKNATSHGVIEYDFFGKTTFLQTEIPNILRMRHAHFLLDWEKTQLLIGQAYHPLYITHGDPRTISFNTGIPMDTFSRNPQFRITWQPIPSLRLVWCASTQLDFKSDGPLGSSARYLRDAVVPMLDFRIETKFSDHYIGLGVDFKRLRPRLETATGVRANETINSAIAIAYTILNWKSFNTRTKFMFVQNGTDQSVIGGYAVHSIDSINDRRTYANLNTIAAWNDSEITKSESIIPGWFIGFAKNLGARETILPNVTDANGDIIEKRIFGFGTDIDYVFRFSPRLSWKVNNFLLGLEIEYTRAAYGTIDDTGNVINTDPVGNTRLLVSLFYYL